MNRVLSIQDISCFGKCSLTLALPVISAMGVECVPVPTAVLSTHTGGLGEVYFTDMSQSIGPVTDHLNRLGVTFNVIYIGYLGSIQLICAIKQLIRTFKSKDTIIMLDPVMGDNGSLYSRFDKDYVKEMQTLAAHVDYIVPNLTEVSFLTDINYTGEVVSEEKLSGIFREFNKRYSSRLIITGVRSDESSMSIVSPEKDGNPAISYTVKSSKKKFHGTGDLFAGVLAGGLAKGVSLEAAVKKAADFTAAVIENTISAGTDERFGLCFESCLSMLTDR